jgi:hypothetical protein
MTTVDSGSVLAHVPSSAEPPPAPLLSTVATPRVRLSRRRVLAALAGAATAVGLAVLDLLPWSRPRAAFAGAYQEWGDCHGFYNAMTVCTPTTALYSGNCSGSWHRNDNGSGTCYSWAYFHDADDCGGNNAWRWTQGSTWRKCSDGYYQYNSCGGGFSFQKSICRTAI